MHGQIHVSESGVIAPHLPYQSCIPWQQLGAWTAQFLPMDRGDAPLSISDAGCSYMNGLTDGVTPVQRVNSAAKHLVAWPRSTLTSNSA